MKEIALFESELKVMKIIWELGSMTAKEISTIAKEEIGWNKNTTYTVLKKLIAKHAIEREEPNFVCKALITIEQVRMQETSKLVNKLYSGSAKLFLSSFLEKEDLSKEELEELKSLLDNKM
jgi:predicted transcriptional regulator